MRDHKSGQTGRKYRLWLLFILLVAGIFGLSYFMGRPKEPQFFEVDVTDKIAEIAQSGSAQADRSASSEGAIR